jgi:hypothetical protein
VSGAKQLNNNGPSNNNPPTRINGESDKEHNNICLPSSV